MTAAEYINTHWSKNEIWRNNQSPHHQKRLSACAGLVEGEKFIDVGCCFGHSTNSLKTLHPGDWSGLDFSKRAVNEARRLFPEITFHHSKNFNMLPVCGKFDSVVCSEVIEHVEEDKELIKGLLGITKNVLIMTTPNRAVNDPGHIRVYNESSLAKLFDGKDVLIKSEGIFFYVRVLV